MIGARQKFFGCLMAVALALLVATPGFAAQKHAAKKKPVKQETPAPQPAPPPAPLRPEQMPSNPPKVTYADGQLTILAQNSTLSDILHAVRTQTGATMDLPAAANERVVGQFGPGPSRQVIASLLNGSHFDYVLMGSEADPNELKQVIVTSKAGTEEPAPAQPEPTQAQAQPPAQEPPEDANADDFSDEAAADAEQVDQPEQAAEEPPAQDPNQQGPKTPEQLLLELQRQNQLLQQQGGAVRPGFPPTPGQQPAPQPQPQQPNPPQ